MPHVLIVEDSPTQAMRIQIMLEDAEHEVAVATSGQEALEILEEIEPDMVLTDLELPNMNGLELIDELQSKYPSLPVVLMTAHGSEEIAVKALRKGAASYVPKRNLDQELISTLEEVLVSAKAGRHQAKAINCLVETESKFILDNDPGLVPPLVLLLQEQVKQLDLCANSGLMQVGVALHEALLNSIYHGNLEVSSELRQTDDRAYHSMVEERRNSSPYADRQVYVRARLSREEAIFVIRDEGPGFDPHTIHDPTDPENLEQIGGRGLLLIRTFMDEVLHNDSGNEITMIFKPREPIEPVYADADDMDDEEYEKAWEEFESGEFDLSAFDSSAANLEPDGADQD